jgi:multidrug efflux pump
VVDDGIVVTENIYKKMEAGLDKYTAAREGSNEIYFAVIATSITLAAVFLPIIFLEGFVGRLFREFGIVVAGAVLISAFVSLTLTPVLNIKMSRKVHKHSAFYEKTEFIFRGMEDWYNRVLKSFIKFRVWAIVIILACFAIIFLIGKIIPSELAPLEDKSQFRLSVSAPEGTAYGYMDNFMDKVSRFIQDSVPEGKIVISITAPGFTGAGSVNSGFVRVVLEEPEDRNRSQQEIVDMVNKYSKKFTEGRVSAIQEQTISVNRRGGQPVQFVLQHVNFERLKEKLPIILEEAQASKILSGADVDLKFNKPELRVIIDRQKASALGVSVQSIASALQLAYSSRRLGYFDKDGKQYQIIGQVDVTDRDNPADLNSIFVRNSRGQQLSINNFATYEEQSSPPTIYHFNRYKSATISANTEKGFTVGDGIKEMQRIADKHLDDTFQTALTGTSRDFQESGSNTAFAFILALILIYLILAAQFESFTDPFIIMITVPLALAGALLSLQLFGQTLNIFSQIGMIMLIGLVTKNGILIVEFANKKREEGIDKFQAVREASVARLRPILMTSLAMSLGALPLALSLGDASTSRIPLGIVIVGGVMFSLVLTLLVIPAMYTFLSKKRGPNELEMADI